ncbi:hypothetical protein [Sphingomonas sp. ERG5]
MGSVATLGCVAMAIRWWLKG